MFQGFQEYYGKAMDVSNSNNPFTKLAGKFAGEGKQFPVARDVPEMPRSLALADVNGDGFVDALVGDWTVKTKDDEPVGGA